jgi:hypothetical protein
MTTVFALFLIAHGLLHIAIYAMPKDPSKPAPFDPSHSWVLASRDTEQSVMHSSSIAAALTVAAAYAAAGWLLLFGASWVAAALVGAALGVALKVLWFHPWLTIGLALDLSVLAAALTGWPS